MLLPDLHAQRGQGASAGPVARYVKVPGDAAVMLDHVRIIDGTGAPALDDAYVLIEHGKIAYAGKTPRPDQGAVKHLDLSGIIYDIAAHGWAGAQKRPGEAENIVHPNPQRRLAKFDERREAARKKIEARKAEAATQGDPFDQPKAAE